ncbi:MAG: type II toxin-antitoxin system RelE/ParE family toxin [Verrucomicrobia bacterium]|nr:type II toxin-antitoxin system RelE/ParE family toxin [Verrucomicrobiota bacterium]
MVFQVAVTPGSRHDLREIQRYIARDSVFIAQRFVSLLRAKTKILGRHPEIGRVVPEFNHHAIREIIVKNYRVIYYVDLLNKKIEVLRYWHTARGTPNILPYE